MTVASQGIEIPPASASQLGRLEGRLRLALSSRAPAFLRLHLHRGAARMAVLVSTDLLALAVLWRVFSMLSLDPAGSAHAAPRGQYVLAVLFGLAVFKCYGRGDQRRHTACLTGAAGLGTGLAFWATLWSAAFIPAAGSLLLIWLMTTVGLVLSRRVVDLVARKTRPSRGHVMRAAVIGAPDEAVALVDHPALGETPWCHLVTCYDPRNRTPSEAATAFAQLIRSRRIDTVILATYLDNAVYANVLDTAVASGCQVLSFPRISPTPTLSPRVVWRDGVPIVEHTRSGVLGVGLMVKRVADATLAALALAALAPLMFAVAFLIRLQSSGPVFFRQVRIGQGGRQFRIVKFRTMVPGAEDMRGALQSESLYPDARLFKVAGDPRITPLGAILRRTSIDELPQLWNVLVGDMSLVGPRPPLPQEVELYKAKDYARFDVKPGITGPWQVGGRNTICDFDEVVRIETSYIRRWTLWLDLTLLLRTIPAVFSGHGAH